MAQSQHAAKEVIAKEGDPGQKAYVVLSGKVELVRVLPHGEVQLGVLTPGMCFGESSLIEPGTPYSSTARAMEPTTLESMEAGDLEKTLKQLPPAYATLIQSIVNRFHKTFVRPDDNASTAAAVPKANVNKILVTPGSEALSKQFKDMAVSTTNLPFRIGGFPSDNIALKNRHNHLNIASDGPPLTVSRMHCEIGIENEGICMTDLGSRFCTMVNGNIIGRGRGRYQAPLAKGKNEIVLGVNSPYKLIVLCE